MDQRLDSVLGQVLLKLIPSGVPDDEEMPNMSK